MADAGPEDMQPMVEALLKAGADPTVKVDGKLPYEHVPENFTLEGDELN